MKLKACFVVFVIISTCCRAYAYDDKKVHPAINENAIYQSGLENMLTKLGYHEGIDTEFQGVAEKLSVKNWIKQGGTDEDNNIRPLNHFHDPLEPWENAGLGLPLTESSLIWAQTSGLVQSFSWSDARSHYYNALQSGNEASYALTFKTLGQLMHLISDKAVPAHVRNDPHPVGNLIPDGLEEPDVYEWWAKNNSTANHNVLHLLQHE